MKFPTSAELRTASEQDLRDLNAVIVNAIRERHTRKQQEAAMQFHVGDTVEFRSGKNPFNSSVVRITIDRVNTKSLSGHTPQGGRWKVAPTLCTKVAA